MRSVSSTSPAVIFSGLLLVALALTGCDNEALVSSPADQDDRALSALGTDHDVLARVDVRGLTVEADKVLAVFPEESRESYRGLLQYLDQHTRLRADQDVQTAWIAMSDNEAMAIFFADHDLSIFADTSWEKTSIAGHDVFVTGHQGDQGSDLHIASWRNETIVMTTGPAHMKRAVESFQGAVQPVSRPELIRQVQSADAWVHVRDVPGALADAPAMGGRMAQLAMLLHQLKSAAGGMVVSDGSFRFELHAQPRDSVSSADLVSIARGGIALLKMQQEVPAELSPLLDEIEIKDRNGFLFVSLNMSAEQLAFMMESFGE